MSTQKIVVIGGSAAGAKAAAKARRLNEFAEITIIQKSVNLSMAACGYPYYIGGTFNDRNMLLGTPAGVIRDAAFFNKAKKITALTETEVTSIDRVNKQVCCADLRNNKEQKIAYDKLIIASGGLPRLPPVPGINLKGVTTLLSMEDADYLRSICDEKKVRNAVIIGGGLIGVEACEALQLAGIQVTLIQRRDQILPFLDKQLAKLAENHMKAKCVNVLTDTGGIQQFNGSEDGKVTGVTLLDGAIVDCEVAIRAVGVRPNAKLAQDAGLEIGECGGITVDNYMQTSDPDIYAAGDCVEIDNLNTGGKVSWPMGDLANLEGRVAGENAMLGNSVTFPGTWQTGICKIFDFSAGATGLSEKTAVHNGITNYMVSMNASPDKPGLMGGKLLVSKLIINPDNQCIIGYQCVGPGDVSKQIASAALAIKGKLTVEDLVHADLPYAPPFSQAIDHFIASAHIMQNKLKGRMRGISAESVLEKLQNGEKPFFLDVRGQDEYDEMRLGVGEKLIPLGMLRSRLDELPEDKSKEIICYCKISLRGYEAATALEAYGFTNVWVMEGGLMAWPYSREK